MTEKTVVTLDQDIAAKILQLGAPRTPHERLLFAVIEKELIEAQVFYDRAQSHEVGSGTHNRMMDRRSICLTMVDCYIYSVTVYRS